MQLRAAGQAGDGAEHVLPAPGGRLGGDVLVADEAGQVVARAAALLDVGGDGAHPRVGQVPGHLAEGVGHEDHVGVGDQQRLHPVVAQDDAQAVVERVRLPLAALVAAQVNHVARVLRLLGLGYLRRLVRTRVVDQEDPQPVPRVLQRHEPVDRGSDDRRLIPGRDQDRGARVDRLAGAVMVTPEVAGDQQELPGGGQLGDGAGHHQYDQHPVAAPDQVVHHRGQAPAVSRTER